MKNISLVLPVFNEKKSLLYVIKSWHQFLLKENIAHEFVICEDGSTDGTKELVQELNEIYPISNQSSYERLGYGGGVTRGIKASKFEYILCIDSDGQCMPNSFMKFYNCEKKNDIIIGNRNPRRDPGLRIIYSKLLKVFHDLLFNSKITDPSCPYIFAKKEIFLELLPKLSYVKEAYWWGFVGAATMLEKKIIEYDIEHFERYDGSSVVYKFYKMPGIIIRNLIGLLKLKKSFKANKL
jgi:glycosyltransferase involved in cell wall biosynthesis